MVDLIRCTSFSAKDDDNFQLWPAGDAWRIIYCIPMTEWDVDYRYWSDVGWVEYEDKSSTYEGSALEEAIEAAWAARGEAE